MAASQIQDGIRSSQKSVTTAGTAVALEGSQKLARSLLVIPYDSNTGNIYIGASDVDSSTTKGLTSGRAITFNNPRGIDLAKVFIDADTAGEGVDFYAVS
jgi:hypothetical protein